MFRCRESAVTPAVFIDASAQAARRSKFIGPVSGYGLGLMVSLLIWWGVWSILRSILG